MAELETSTSRSPTCTRSTASDGYRWHYRRYAPPGEPRGRVVFLHGIQSHGGWYARSCAQLAAAGYEVYFLDRRGCGLNTATPRRRPELPPAARRRRRVRPHAADGQAAAPMVLAASRGAASSAVGLPYRHPGLVDGLVLLCPGFCPKVAPPFCQRLRIGRCAGCAPDADASRSR